MFLKENIMKLLGIATLTLTLLPLISNAAGITQKFKDLDISSLE